MGLSGSHNLITKDMAREILPPAACRSCVWLARHLLIHEESARRQPPFVCEECAIIVDRAALLDEIHRRGWARNRDTAGADLWAKTITPAASCDTD